MKITLLVFLSSIVPASCFQSPLSSSHTKTSMVRNNHIVKMIPRNIHTDETEDTMHINRRSFVISTTSFASTLLLQPTISKAEEQESSPPTPPPMATFAMRRAGALPVSTQTLPPSKLGFFLRFGEGLLYSDDATRNPGKDVYASFEYPSDWLQLDRMMGGVQFVDQRNGDKLYLLKVKLPDGVESIKDVSKAYLGDAIFNPKGDLVRTGNNVEDYKVLSGKMITEDTDENGVKNGEIPRRRFKIRYTTLTGNNFTVERKGLVDAYSYKGMIYMLMTGSNSVLFDKKGRERDTVEYICDTFRVTPV